VTRLSPSRFGRRRRYALGKMAGKASVDQNLKALGIKLPPEKRDLVLRRIVELGDKKHNVTPEDLPLIIADVLKTPGESLVRIERYEFHSASDGLPGASVSLRYHGKLATASSTGDGGYDAFMKALAKAVRELRPEAAELVDTRVRIRPAERRRLVRPDQLADQRARSRSARSAWTRTSSRRR
jgi:D-citramalate synthase